MSDEIPEDFVIDYTDPVQRYLALCDLLLNALRNRETYPIIGRLFAEELTRIANGRGDGETSVNNEAMREARRQILGEPVRVPFQQRHLQPVAPRPYPNIRALIYRTQQKQRREQLERQLSLTAPPIENGSNASNRASETRSSMGNSNNFVNRFDRKDETASTTNIFKQPLRMYRSDL